MISKLRQQLPKKALNDLGRLKRVSIDRAARRAMVQPAITGRELSRMLNAQGLAFPVGHCPTVPMSGFLLNGGIGWNFNDWGPSCFGVEAARVVTADGRLVVASDKENSDLLWAIRGGGPGFFGVVTEYTLATPRSRHRQIFSRNETGITEQDLEVITRRM